jgi:hypothetical protein
MKATTGIAFSLMHNDPQGAVAFIQSLPQGKSKDQAAQNLSMNMARIDAQAAIALASGIADPTQRSSAQQGVVRTWMRNDSAAATQWVNSSSLPQDVKNRLLQPK